MSARQVAGFRADVSQPFALEAFVDDAWIEAIADISAARYASAEDAATDARWSFDSGTRFRVIDRRAASDAAERVVVEEIVP